MKLVTVIIPTYKGSCELSRAIDSVLNQSYKNMEIIVVDDNAPKSVDRKKTELVMKKYVCDTRVIYKKHDKNKNGAVARNTGIAVARGDYIAFLDDDDYYLPKRIEYSVRYLEKNVNAVGVYVGVDVLDNESNICLQVRPQKNLTISDLLTDEMVIGTGSNIFIRSDIAKQINGFDGTFVRRQDIEFMIRVCHKGIIGFIPELMIIKSVNGTINYPKYNKMKETIQLFTDKFAVDIDRLENKKNTYYTTQYRSLLEIAYYERNKNEIREARALVQRYDKLSLYDNLRLFMYMTGIRDCFLGKFLVSFKNSVIYKKRK